MGKDLCRRNYTAREDTLAPRGRHSALPTPHTGNHGVSGAPTTAESQPSSQKVTEKLIFTPLSSLFHNLSSHTSYPESVLCHKPHLQRYPVSIFPSKCVSVSFFLRFLLPERIQKVSLRPSVEGIVSCFFSNGNS